MRLLLIRIHSKIRWKDHRQLPLIGWVCILVLLLAPNPGAAVKPPIAVSEHELKAVYLERLTRFIEWPAGHEVSQPSKPFVIGVIGIDPFKGVLPSIFNNQRIKGKPVQVLRIRDPADRRAVTRTHLLFIGKLNNKDLQVLLDMAREESILTVSDTPGFGEFGVMVNFFVDDDRLRFEINPKPVHQAHLDISYVLLRSAQIVGGED